MLALDDSPVDFNCGTFDVGCHMSEWATTQVVSAIGGMGNFIGDTFRNTFTGTGISDKWWDVADTQFWWWVSIMAVVVMIILIYQVSIAIILRDMRRIFTSALGAVCSVALASVSVIVMRKAIQAADSLAAGLASKLTDEGSMSEALINMSGMSAMLEANNQSTEWIGDPGEGYVAGQIETGMAQAEGFGLGPLLMAAFLVLLLMVAAAILFFMMTIRNFALIALAALAPIGLMMVGQGKLTAWAGRWTSMVVGLLMAKPLAAGILVLAVNIVVASDPAANGSAAQNSTNLADFFVAIGAVFAASLAPVWAVRLVSFAGAESGNALQHRASMTRGIQKTQTLKGVARVGRR